MMLMLMMTMMMMMSRRRMIAVQPGARETKLWLSKETVACFLKSCIGNINMVITVKKYDDDGDLNNYDDYKYFEKPRGPF